MKTNLELEISSIRSHIVPGFADVSTVSITPPPAARNVDTNAIIIAVVIVCIVLLCAAGAVSFYVYKRKNVSMQLFWKKCFPLCVAVFY